MSRASSSGGRLLVWSLVGLLFVLHQDFWWWDDRTLVLGFLPVTLAYHAIYSLLAGGVWALANRLAWPADIEAWADEAVGSGAAAPEERS